MEDIDEYEYKGHDISIFRYYNEMVCKLNEISIPFLSINKEKFLQTYRKRYIFDLISLGQMMSITKNLLDILNEIAKNPDDQYSSYLEWKKNRKEEIDKMVDMHLKNVCDIDITDEYLNIWNKTTDEHVKIHKKDLLKASEFLINLEKEETKGNQ